MLFTLMTEGSAKTDERRGPEMGWEQLRGERSVVMGVVVEEDGVGMEMEF